MKQYTVTMQITYTVAAKNKEEARQQAVLQLPEKFAFAKLQIVALKGDEEKEKI